MPRYRLNTVSHEVHDRAASEERCQLDDAEHLKDINLTQFRQLLRDGAADFCDFCFSDLRFGQWTTSPAASDSVTSSPDSRT